MNEEKFLKRYNIAEYPRPSLAVDTVIFSVLQNTPKNYRKLPELTFSVLLIERAEHPFKNKWALPGGFLRPKESVEAAARRELKEETGLTDVAIKQLNVFSEPKRDPRGWILSCAFMALANAPQKLIPATDSRQAKWFSCSYTQIKEKTKKSAANSYEKIRIYKLILTNEKTKLSAVIEENKKISLYDRRVSYTILENNGLAFDHAKIIAAAVSELRSSLESSADAFRFLPEEFTLTELQNIYETILGKKLIAPNFRRKIAPYVLATENFTAGRGHRSAKLYKRNIANFLKEE